MLEHLDLLDDCQVLIVGRHAQHEAVLHIEGDLARVPVLTYERVQGVCVWHPSNQACTGAQSHHTAT